MQKIILVLCLVLLIVPSTVSAFQLCLTANMDGSFRISRYKTERRFLVKAYGLWENIEVNVGDYIRFVPNAAPSQGSKWIRVSKKMVWLVTKKNKRYLVANASVHHQAECRMDRCLPRPKPGRSMGTPIVRSRPFRRSGWPRIWVRR